MPRNSKQLVEARSIRIRLMEDNKSDRQIIQELGINNHTYYTYKSRIQKEDAHIWDRIHMDSAKYRATQFIKLLEECFLINRAIALSNKEDSRVRIEASKAMCEAAANIFKIVNEGSIFKPSLTVDMNRFGTCNMAH